MSGAYGYMRIHKSVGDDLEIYGQAFRDMNVNIVSVTLRLTFGKNTI